MRQEEEFMPLSAFEPDVRRAIVRGEMTHTDAVAREAERLTDRDRPRRFRVMSEKEMVVAGWERTTDGGLIYRAPEGLPLYLSPHDLKQGNVSQEPPSALWSLTCPSVAREPGEDDE